MRTITKVEPQAFIAWKTQTPGAAGTGQGAYSEIPPEVAAAVREALCREQGWLDAYTGERIKLGVDVQLNGRRDGDAFHVEHLYPQEHCDPAEKVDYSNMAACRPGQHETIQKLPYGARYKDDQHWPDRHERMELVRPATPGTEARFHYDATGEMSPTNPADGAAKHTICRVNLNEKPLISNRAAAYESATGKGTLSVIEAEKVGSLTNPVVRRSPSTPGPAYDRSSVARTRSV